MYSPAWPAVRMDGCGPRPVNLARIPNESMNDKTHLAPKMFTCLFFEASQLTLQRLSDPAVS
jgi:hypothetical protein